MQATARFTKEYSVGNTYSYIHTAAALPIWALIKGTGLDKVKVRTSARGLFQSQAKAAYSYIVCVCV